MEKTLEGWLDIIKHDGVFICKTSEEVGRIFGLEFEETLIGQLQEFDSKKVQIIIREIS